MVTRYELTEEVDTGVLDVTPVPENHEGRFVAYEDYEALEKHLLALLDHPAMKAHSKALASAQITGLAFIRVNANGHVQVLPSDRVQLSVIKVVEERTTAAAHQECDHVWFRSPATGALHCTLCGDGLTRERKIK